MSEIDNSKKNSGDQWESLEIDHTLIPSSIEDFNENDINNHGNLNSNIEASSSIGSLQRLLPGNTSFLLRKSSDGYDDIDRKKHNFEGWGHGRQRIIIATTALILILISLAVSSFSKHSKENNPIMDDSKLFNPHDVKSLFFNHERSSSSSSSIRVAFVGNSILYYNDCPRVVQAMLDASHYYNVVEQDSCLRGGATLSGLLRNGNGMLGIFGKTRETVGAPTVKALLLGDDAENDDDDEKHQQPRHYQQQQQQASSLHWDFVVMNDQTQEAARHGSRQATISALRSVYADWLRQCGATPVLVQTAAYQVLGWRDTEDLGTVDQFTTAIYTGYQIYASTLDTLLPKSRKTRIAPVGLAFAALYHGDRDLWNKMFQPDHVHFSGRGTWLEACILFATIVPSHVPIPTYQHSFFQRSRYLHPDPIPVEEAETLRLLAHRIVTDERRR